MPNFWMKLPCPKSLVNGLGYILKTVNPALQPLDWTKNSQAMGLCGRDREREGRGGDRQTDRYGSDFRFGGIL